jgi:DNA-binding transcriptional LysR family regulator
MLGTASQTPNVPTVPMKSPDLNLLQIAFAVYDELSVSRAAKVLGMSQPAVSMALRRLRETFNDPLFVRVPSGIAPTPRAHALVRSARPVVEQLRSTLLEEEGFDPSRTTRTFTVALSDVGELAFLPRLLDMVTQKAPLSAIRSVFPQPAQLAADLDGGIVDVAIGYYPVLTSKNFRQRRLNTQQFAALIRADHPQRSAKLSMSAFTSLGHAVVQPEGRSQEVLERFLAARKIQRKAAVVTSHFLSIPLLVAHSDLIAVVPRPIATYFAGMSPGLAVAELPFDLTGFDLKLHWHRRFDNDPRHRWLREELAVLFTRRA